MVKDMDPPTGMGTFTFLECDYSTFPYVCAPVTYRIVKVDTFIPHNGCGAPAPGFPPSPCASIVFRAEVVGGQPCDLETGAGCHIGHAEAFDRASCLVPDSGGEGFDFICNDE
jgi:hypothetical protein